jgi:hypothetical protein
MALVGKLGDLLRDPESKVNLSLRISGRMVEKIPWGNE